MNTITRTALGTIGGAGMVVAGLGAVPAQAAPLVSQAAADVCLIRVLSVQAVDLQEDRQGNDEIFIRLGDSRTVQRSYVEGQKRNTLSDGEDHFIGSEDVRLVENDGPGNNDVIDSGTIACTTGQVTSTLTDSTADAVYTVLWRVDVIS